MKRMGLIAGTVFFGQSRFQETSETVLRTPYGDARVFVGRELAFIPRHGKDASAYVMPHRINHAANLCALKQLDVAYVVAVHSTGSLKRSLPPRTVVVPDDFISLCSVPSIFQEQPGHVTPVLSDTVRRRILDAARAEGVPVVAGGVYWQSTGPRLETRAEIRLMARFADLVGMTLASEATIATEMDIPFASLCSVDNYAHGVTDTPVSEEAIRSGAAQNAETMARIVLACLDTHG